MNKTTKTVVGVIALIVVVAVIVAATRATKSEQSNPKTLTIGVISPLTGDFAAVGQNIVNGIQTAKAVYEAKTGNTVNIVVQDDGGDAAKGLSAYRKLTDTGHIDGLINTFTTTMDAIYDIAKTKGYPVMMEAFQANNVADDYVFQMTPGNDGTWSKYAAYIQAMKVDQKNFVVVHSQDAAQASFADAFKASYKGDVTLFTASSDKNTLKTDAAKIAALKPTAILFIMTPENGAILTKNIRPLIASNVALFYDLQLTTGLQYYKQQLGDKLAAIEGATSITLEGVPNKEFIDAYHALYGATTEPGFLADFGYDTLLVYLAAYDKDNTTWISNLKTTKTDGASGHIEFDKNGIRFPDLAVKKVMNGTLQTVDRFKP
jgi:branched-chain amino acid transport system substrate-binding protein